MKKLNFVLVLIFLFICIFFVDINPVLALKISGSLTEGSLTLPRLDESDLGTLDKEQATITISGINTGDKLSAYKILDVYKNSITNEINYRYTDSFYDFLKNNGGPYKDAEGNIIIDYSSLTEEKYKELISGDITNGSTQTSSTLDKLMSLYANYVIKNNISGVSLSNSGTTASLTTTTGSYLILPTETNRLYAVMVANLDYEEQNGEWAKQNESIVAKVSDPSVDASIGKIGQDKASFSIGEEYTYFIEATVPPYPTNSQNYIFHIGTILGDGISYVGLDTLTIKDGDKVLNVIVENGTIDGVEYVARIADGDNTVGSISNKFNEREAYVFSFDRRLLAFDNLTISFKSKLNNQSMACRGTILNKDITSNDFVLGSNDMLAILGYSHAYMNYTDNYLENLDISALISYKLTYAFTYKVQIDKHVLGDSTKKLGGAVFEIYSDVALTNKVGSVTTDIDGFAEFYGLKEGKYYLKEVTAPTGYSLLKLPIEIEIKYDESLVDSETGEYCGPIADISNTKISALPITGGIGTLIFISVGILLITSAILGTMYYRKKKTI